MPNATFREVAFERSKLMGVDWTQTRAGDPQATQLQLSLLRLTESVLDYSNFFGLRLREMSLEKCRAHEVNFSEADLTGAVCRNTDFMGSTFLRTVLEQADFTGAINYAIDPTTSNVKGARFSLPEAVSLLRPFGVVIEL